MSVLELVNESRVVRKHGAQGRTWLTVEHQHECATCDGTGRVRVGNGNSPFRLPVADCEECDGGFWFDEDCGCVTCLALGVKYEVIDADCATPAALALVEFWARQLCAAALLEADEELRRRAALVLLTEAQ